VNDRVKEAQVAWMILTRLPSGRIEGTAPPIASAAWAFPLVGLVIGALMAAAFNFALWLGLPSFAAALLALATAALTTGALHEDGLADLADGFGGGATISRKLEIMRDSRIGSYGVLALILILGLTASGMAEGGTTGLFLAIGAASRATMLLPMSLLPPAREDGLGRSATMPLDARFAAAFGIALLVTLATGTLAIVLPTLLATVAVMLLARAQIGGQTGDVLGATQKLAECAGWLTAAALAT
jgi:adenosylcobinamide-GDP ribazoletransferase